MQPRYTTLKRIAEVFELKVEDLEGLAEVKDTDVTARLAKDDPELAALLAQIPLLNEQQTEALRVFLRSMIAYQKVREVTGEAG